MNIATTLARKDEAAIFQMMESVDLDTLTQLANAFQQLAVDMQTWPPVKYPEMGRYASDLRVYHEKQEALQIEIDRAREARWALETQQITLA
ncbi:MAG: hypothetical protein ABI947_28095 [Chloroflexota bacterium]